MWSLTKNGYGDGWNDHSYPWFPTARFPPSEFPSFRPTFGTFLGALLGALLRDSIHCAYWSHVQKIHSSSNGKPWSAGGWGPVSYPTSISGNFSVINVMNWNPPKKTIAIPNDLTFDMVVTHPPSKVYIASFILCRKKLYWLAYLYIYTYHTLKSCQHPSKVSFREFRTLEDHPALSKALVKPPRLGFGLCDLWSLFGNQHWQGYLSEQNPRGRTHIPS